MDKNKNSLSIIARILKLFSCLFSKICMIIKSSIKSLPLDSVIFTACFLCFFSLSMLLIWRYPFNPFVDEPVIMSSAVIYHHHNDLNWNFQEWFEERKEIISHRAYYYVMDILLFIFPPLVASKAFLSLVILLLPISMMFFFQSIGKSKWLSLSGFALSFSYNMNMGYFPFLMGVPLWPLGLFLIENNSKHFKCWKAALIALLVYISSYIHYFFAGFLLLTYFIWTILSSPNWKKCLTGLITLFVPVIILYMISSHSIMRSGIHEIWNVRINLDLVEKVKNLQTKYFMTWTKNGLDAISSLFLTISVFLALLLRPVPNPNYHMTSGIWHKFRGIRFEIMLIIIIVFYIICPNALGSPFNAFDIDSRYPVFFGIMLSGLPWFKERKIKDLKFHIPIILFTAFHLCSLIPPFYAFGKDAAPMKEVTEVIPLGSRVFPAFIHYEFNTDNSKKLSFYDFHRNVNLHLPEWVTALRGGYNPYTFCSNNFHIFRCRKDLPSPPGNNRIAITSQQLMNYDYLLLYENYLPGEQSPQNLKLLLEKYAILQKRKGMWSVWKIKHPNLK